MANTLKKTQAFVATAIILSIMTFIAVIYFQHKAASIKNATAYQELSKNLETDDFKIAAKKQEELWQKITIKPGDTLRSIFATQHLHIADLTNLLKLNDSHLTLLHPGQIIQVRRDAQNHLLALRMPTAIDKALLVSKKNGSFVKKTIQLPIETDVNFSSGVIKSSLAAATKNAGLTTHMYYQLVKIFQGKVNFSHDLRQGDRFSLLYKEYSVDGRKLNRHEIIAAKLMTQKQDYYAIRFSYPTHRASYYTPKGHSIEPRFLDYPCHFRRISSRFSYHRLDPIVHNVRPHLGVDFAAKTGTPVHAIGDGRITFVGREHGYGNAIKIRYDRRYSSLYAHLHNFASTAKLHSYVHKGDVIGYIGSTGWSTGPHLHFSFYENGQAKDWLSLQHPTANPIPKRYQKQFRATAETFLAKLEMHDTGLAANNIAPLKTTR